MNSSWKSFEQLAAQIQKQLSPEAQVEHNLIIIGDSGARNQCDVVIRSKIGQFNFLALLECKDWGDKVGIPIVREFDSKLRDVGAHKGAIVSAKGFTEDATSYAEKLGISLYTLVDAQSIKWRDQAIIPVLVIRAYLSDAIIKTIDTKSGKGVHLTKIDDGSIASPDESYLYDKERNRYVTFRQFSEERWDLESDLFLETPNILLTTEPGRYFLYVDAYQLVSVTVEYTFIPKMTYHYSYISLSQCKGFIDKHSGQLLTDAFESNPIVIQEVLDSWPFVEAEDDVPFKTVHNFRIINRFTNENEPPLKAIVIEMSTKGFEDNSKQEVVESEVISGLAKDTMSRAFNPDTDFPALAELLNNVAKADSGTLTTEAEQREDVESFEKWGFVQQWVISKLYDTREIIAYGWLYQPQSTSYADFVVIVHPDYRQAGLDKQLLEILEQKAKENDVNYLYALAKDKSSFQQFLLRQGFKQERGFHLLDLDVAEIFPFPEIPPDFVLRAHEQVNDINILVEIDKKGWSNLPGHTVPTYEQTREMLETNPNDVIYLLFDANSQVIGRVGVTLKDSQGTVDSPAIAPEHRTPEMYKTLVLLGLHDLSKRGCKQVQMYSWGDYDSTIAAYTELGFKTTVHELGYRLDVL
jgi:N-acetylglutamate synthase-like GNAT family acetyltransferase